VDALIDDFALTLDQGEQAEILTRLQDIVREEVPNFYVNSQLGNAAMSTRFDGFNLHPSQLLRFYTTHLA
jgi:ABC-type transport system substrate-binding protein